EAPEVANREGFAGALELCVSAGDRDVVEEDLALGRAADERLSLGRVKCLSRDASARANDEDRAARGRDRGVLVLTFYLGIDAHRGLGARFRCEDCAAARAVVRRRRAQEAALGAIDVRSHASPSLAFGAALP